jgi:hypothetical protein
MACSLPCIVSDSVFTQLPPLINLPFRRGLLVALAALVHECEDLLRDCLEGRRDGGTRDIFARRGWDWDKGSRTISSGLS